MKTKNPSCFINGAIAIVCLFSIGACIQAENRSATRELYKSSVLTPLNSFTGGVEGPAVDKDGNIYAVNFQEEGTVGKIPSGGKAVLFASLPGGSVGNGIRFDSKANMLIADYVNHNIIKIELPSKQLSIYSHNPQMNQPNDIAIDRHDRLYASDPDWDKGTGKIWRINTDGTAFLLEENMGTVNGIEVSPDDKKLYVNESVQRNIWVYDLSAEGAISNKQLLLSFPDFGLDGMRCDTIGNIYVTRYGKGTVVTVSEKGEVLREISLKGENPSNIAFGGKDGCTVYVTVQDQGNIETFLVDVPGREWNMMKYNSAIK